MNERLIQLLARLASTAETVVENETGKGPLASDELDELWAGLIADSTALDEMVAESGATDPSLAQALAEIADAMEATKGARDARDEQLAEIGRQAEEQRARIAALRGETPAGPEDDPDSEDEPEQPVEEPQPAPSADETVEEPAVEPVAAAAPLRMTTAATVIRNRPPRNAPVETAAETDDRAVRIVAAAGLSNVEGGREMTFAEVGEACFDAWQAGRGTRDTQAVRVATFETPADRSDVKLGDDQGGRGQDTLQAILASARQRGTMGPEALEPITAAGGLCGPPEVIYDWPTIGNARTPVADALPRMPATRGQVQYPTPYSWIDVQGVTNGVVNDWTLQNDIDAASNSTPRKNVARVLCPTWVTATLNAVYSQIEFGNFAARFNPLVNDNFMREVPKVVAKFMEAEFLAAITAASAAGAGLGSSGRGFDYTTGGGGAGTILGTARDLKALLSWTGEYYRSFYRMNVDDPLVCIAPQWILRALQEDLLRQIPGDNEFEATLAEIQAEVFDNANVQLVLSPEQNPLQGSYPWHIADASSSGSPPVTAAAHVTLPTSADLLLFPPDTFTVLDGGQMDLGVIRDSTLVAKNDFLIFSEWFQKVIQTGFASWSLKVPVLGRGGTAATITNTSPGY